MREQIKREQGKS